MNKEDFVSLEMAKILKDKEFDSPILYECWKYDMDNEDFYIMPTLYEVHKWLRDKKHVYIEVSYMYDNYWDYEIWSIPMNKKLIRKDRIVEYESYEDALREGISDVLEIIK